jgi:hypothetical protein
VVYLLPTAVSIGVVVIKEKDRKYHNEPKQSVKPCKLEFMGRNDEPIKSYSEDLFLQE